MPGARPVMSTELALSALRLTGTMVTYVLPSEMLTVREFLDREGSSPFAKWFGSLDATAAAKVTTGSPPDGAGELFER